VLLESSGPEGQPKSVLLTQAALVWQLEAHQRALALAPHDVRVLTLPWSHAFGLVLDLLLGLVSQQTLVVAPLSTSWSPRSLALLLKEVEATWWCTVPRVLELMVGAAPSPGGPLRVLVGGAPVGPSLRETAREWLGAGGRLHVGYGLTEAGPGVSLDGRLLPGVSARLEDGRLFVQSPAWCGPESESGWHDTGDLATLDADGQLEVLGRTGRRVKGPDATWQSLDLLEQELARRPGLRAATIDRREQGWSVAVLLDDGAGPPAGLERFLERRIGGPIALRWERATPRLLAALAAIPAKSLSVALARVLGDPQLHDWAPAWA
jgi:long-subunit acyl-CoA synthetase (AMP-forming)